MAPSASDLRELLDERSMAVPPVADLAAAARRRARRRRVVTRAALAAGVVGLLFVVSTPVRDGGGDGGNGAAGEPAKDLLPEYTNGGRLDTFVRVNLPQREATLRFTAQNPNFFLAVDCDVILVVELWVNGHRMPDTGCRMDAPPSVTDFPRAQRADAWAALGVVPGKESTVSVRLIESGNQATQGTYGVGVYRAVPFDQYPLPPRPDTIEEVGNEGFTGEDSRPLGECSRIENGWQATGEPNTTITKQITMPYGLMFLFQTTAPGRIRILLDGHEVTDHAGWAYTNVSGWADSVSQTLFADAPVVSRAGIREGDPVELSIVTENFADPAWFADVLTCATP